MRVSLFTTILVSCIIFSNSQRDNSVYNYNYLVEFKFTSQPLLQKSVQNPFDRYSNLMNSLKSCVIHFSWIANANILLQESFLDECQTNEISFCTTIQTRNSSHSKHASRNKSYWEIWKLSMFEDFSPIS